MPEHATRTPTRHEQVEAEKKRFWHGLGEAPPGQRPLLLQFIGWALMLQGGAMAIVLLRSATGQDWVALATIVQALGAAAFIGAGILVDRAHPWGLPTGVLVSLAGTLILGQAYLATGSPLAGVGAILDLGILIGLILFRGRFRDPGQLEP